MTILGKRYKIWVILGAVLIGAIIWAAGDNARGSWLERTWHEARLDVAPADNNLYQEECGSCHFAYQPGLLPAKSWESVMDQLENHFGENAELDAQTLEELKTYLMDNAADRSKYKRSKRFASSAAGSTPVMRITETRYFQKKHDEIPQWLLQKSRKKLTFVQCDSCHRSAENGSYDEHEIWIPGLGRWDD